MSQKLNLNNYSLTLLIVLMSLIFILSTAIIGTFGNIKSKSKKLSFLEDSKQLFSRNYSAIAAIFSLEFLLVIAFIIVIIIRFMSNENIEFLLIYFYFLGQFLYFIICVIIPIYYKEYKFIIKVAENINHPDLNELLDIASEYKGIIWGSYIFLIIFVLLDFLLLNLYHYLFCNTGKFVRSFINCFLEIFCAAFHKKKKEIEIKEQLTEEIKELLSEKLSKEITDKKKSIKSEILQKKNNNNNL